MRRLGIILVGFLLAGSATAQVNTNTPNFSWAGTLGSCATGQSVQWSATSGLTCATVPVPTDGGTPVSVAQATSAASNVSTFTNPNLTMPNGANVSHTIFSSAAPVTITGTTDASSFPATGSGSQTVPAAGFFVGAKFNIKNSGIATTGLLNTATVTVKVKIAGTTIVSVTTASLPVNLATIPFDSDTTCTVMSANSVFCFGKITIGSGLTNIAPAISYITATTPTTVTLSAGGKIDGTVAFSNTTGSPSMTIYDGLITQQN